MSSSSWSIDELFDEGRGYVDDVEESSSPVKSSILGFYGGNDQPENASEEGEVEMDVDAARELYGDSPPPAIEGYKWAPHEVGAHAPYFITSASLEYLVGRVSFLASIKDVESIKLVVCIANE